MPIDHSAPLPNEVKELVKKRIAELTEELQTKFDLGFRHGVYILHAVDKAELPDGLWISFSPTMPPGQAHDFLEAGYETMKKFIDSGIIERLKILHEYDKTHPKPRNGNSDPNGVQPPGVKGASHHQ